MSYFKICKKDQQTTLKFAFSLSGKSIINNKKVRVSCFPAEPNTGLVFLVSGQYIRAVYNNCRKSKFHTTELCRGNNKILMVEHVLSAFYGLQIDNVLIRIEGDNQLPLLDGSSQLYAKKIIASGCQKLPARRLIIKVIRPLIFKSRTNGSFTILLPHQSLVVQNIIDFPNLIGWQECTFSVGSNYWREISRARTFLSKSFSCFGWQQVLKQFKGLAPDPHKAPIIIYNQDQYLSRLRYDNEPARHKLLDFLGDLSLLGYQICAKIITYKPSHYFNYQLVRQISRLINNN